MRLIGHTLLSAYQGRIVNIHPSLLPAFPGKDAIGQALAAGVTGTGVTIHYVDEGMDTGPIIDQATVAIGENETMESLAEKIHAVSINCIRLFYKDYSKLKKQRNKFERQRLFYDKWVAIQIFMGNFY